MLINFYILHTDVFIYYILIIELKGCSCSFNVLINLYLRLMEITTGTGCIFEYKIFNLSKHAIPFVILLFT